MNSNLKKILLKIILAIITGGISLLKAGKKHHGDELKKLKDETQQK